MSFQTCWRCLSRASDPGILARRPTSQHPILLPFPAAAFTTSAPQFALPPKKKSTPMKTEKNIRGVKKTFTRKKDKLQKTDRARRPAIGERKALRKRIVLSNTNALEVEGLQDLTPESLVDERLRGQVLGIPGPVVDQLRVVEGFKPSQGWPLFRRPAMLVRRETVDLGKEMEAIESEKKTVRRVLVGERGSGKTIMLLQAMTMAFMKGSVVINIPEGTLNLSCSKAFKQKLTTLPPHSTRSDPCPHRIRPPPLQPKPLHTKNLHRRPPLHTLPVQPHPPIPQPHPAPPFLYNHPNPPKNLSLPPRPPRRLRPGHRLADPPTNPLRLKTPRTTTTNDVSRRSIARHA